MIDLHPDLATMAADALDVVAKQLRRSGDDEAARQIVQQAANIELMSSALQNCWGGPFNGQAGRLQIVQDLLEAIAPQAVVETGTFRGISTFWFSQNFDGPVLSCEAEERNLIQAERRLRNCRNVDLQLSDSRAFLRKVVPRLDRGRAAFFYLDAHWKQDLPLNEELRIIFGALPKAVVMVDDFRIPDDPGYGWDDYGPGVRVDTSALSGALPEGATLFVPRLSSFEETGAKRGCCVIADDLGETLHRCATLRRRSFSELEPTDASNGTVAVPVPEAGIVPDLDGMSPSELMMQISALNKDRAQRLQDVSALTAELNDINKDRAQRFNEAASLTAEVAALKSERAIHLRDNQALTQQIHRLQAVNAELEIACAQRLQDVHTLTDVIERMRSAGQMST